MSQTTLNLRSRRSPSVAASGKRPRAPKVQRRPTAGPGLDRVRRDAVGVADVERAARLGHDVADLRRPADRVSHSRVQRAVGFEYELDSTNVYTQEPKTTGLKGLFSKAPEPLKLKKGMSISGAAFTGFDFSVDSTPEGFDVEVRIQEVDESDPMAEKTLLGYVYQIVSLLKKMNRKDRVTGDFVFGDKRIVMYGDFTSGSLQATAGLDLRALHAFLSGSMGQRWEKRLNAQRGLKGGADFSTELKAYYTRGYGQNPGVLARAEAVIEQQYPKLKEDHRKQLAGVVTTLATIPITARTHAPLKYAKSATTLLARTDYAKIVSLLPAEIFLLISSKNRWRFLVLQTINSYLDSKQLDQVVAGDQIFPKDSVTGIDLKLTLGEWLVGMMPESGSTVGAPSEPTKDLLTQSDYPTGTYTHDDPEELESFGGFGGRTDPGRGGKELPIFEFRKYLKVPLDHLVNVIQGIWQLIREANRLKPGG